MTKVIDRCEPPNQNIDRSNRMSDTASLSMCDASLLPSERLSLNSLSAYTNLREVLGITFRAVSQFKIKVNNVVTTFLPFNFILDK